MHKHKCVWCGEYWECSRGYPDEHDMLQCEQEGAIPCPSCYDKQIQLQFGFTEGQCLTESATI